MATYFVGDLQGCYDELQLLLERVDFNPTQDKLYLVGDSVWCGRYPLRLRLEITGAGNGRRGNHDLHLIATVLDIKSETA